MTSNLDRRVSRTRNQLRRSLLALILEKGYEGVTVEELTERAGIARGTFYLHYRHKEDLMLAIAGELIDDLVDQLSDLPLSCWQMPAEGVAEPIELVFSHAAEHADLYQILLRGEVSFPVARRLRAIILEATRGFLDYKQKQEGLELDSRIPPNAFASYLAGSWMGTIGWWLEQDMPYELEEMAIIFQQMFYHGSMGVLSLTQAAAE